MTRGIVGLLLVFYCDLITPLAYFSKTIPMRNTDYQSHNETFFLSEKQRRYINRTIKFLNITDTRNINQNASKNVWNFVHAYWSEIAIASRFARFTVPWNPKSTATNLRCLRGCTTLFSESISIDQSVISAYRTLSALATFQYSMSTVIPEGARTSNDVLCSIR